MTDDEVDEVRLPRPGVWRIGPGHDPFETRPALTADELSSPRGGNRFDSPLGNYSVLYFGTTLEACFGETLARFRPDLTLSSIVTDDWSELGFMSPGEVAADWRHRRLAVRAKASGDGALFLDVESLVTRSTLARHLGPALGVLGVSDLDVPVVRGGDRRVTRLISHWAWGRVNDDSNHRYAGLRYLSRLRTEWECWALFDRVPTVELARGTIKAENPALRKVAKLYDLRVF